jgi:hypothetical protein
MANLIEQAIACDDGDRAAKMIQKALGIESDRRRKLRISEVMAG